MRDSMAQIRDIPGNPGQVATLADSPEPSHSTSVSYKIDNGLTQNPTVMQTPEFIDSVTMPEGCVFWGQMRGITLGQGVYVLG